MRRFGLAVKWGISLLGNAARAESSFGSPQKATSGGASGNAFSGSAAAPGGVKDGAAAAEAHPMLYNVPALSARTVGRDAEVMALWQSLLSGRRCQVLVGVDGVGKSTIASEFCEAARKSGRFTCIQWFNGQHSLTSQLEQFFASMQGRREKDVLLVLDDVANPEAALKLLPPHSSVYVIATTSQLSIQQEGAMNISPVLPLPPKAAEELAVEVDGAEVGGAVSEVLDVLGFVPLLVNMASLLMSSDVVAPQELLTALEQAEIMQDNTLSISKALSVLCGFAVAELAKEYPLAKSQLAKLACFHLGDISDAVISSVCGDEGAPMAVAASQLGILSLKWEDSAFMIHPSVAAVLRDALTDEDLSVAAAALTALWPRRLRGMGSHLLYHLVWHTYALSGHFTQRGVMFTDDMVKCLDRSATFLAHSEARDLGVAADMWYAAFQHQQRQQQPSAQTVRLSRECGRLLHYLRDERAREVLEAAFAEAIQVHGEDAAESALVMGCLAPYMDASEQSCATFSRCVDVLNSRLASVDYVLGKEEQRMLMETMFVLLVCKGQIIEELGGEVPDALWAELEGVKDRLAALDK